MTARARKRSRPAWFERPRRPTRRVECAAVMGPRYVTAVTLVLITALVGCKQHNDTASSPPPPPPAHVEPSIVRDEAGDLQRLAQRVVAAPDSIAEADALRRLRQY